MGDESATVTAAPPPPAAEAPGAGGDGGSPEARRPASPSLSPSRAGDFLTCPLLYRFRVIDRRPERASQAATRGTLVPSVLERLFDAAAADRTPASARALIEPEWTRLQEAEPDLAGLFDDDAQRDAWLDEVMRMLDRYFTLEDPRRIEPAHRELCVEAELASGLRVRGYIDRLDIAPDGRMRIVDYKTGGAPPEEFEARALFQMRFYALTLWRAPGEGPQPLPLIYLGQREIVRDEPGEGGPPATQRQDQAPSPPVAPGQLDPGPRPPPR